MLGVLDFIGWAVAILAFIIGLVLMIANFKAGEGMGIFLGIVSIIAGVAVFIVVYKWMESIGVCLFATGFIMCMIGLAGQNTSSSASSAQTPVDNGGGFIDNLQREYWEREKIASAVEKGIRNSRD